MLSRSLLTRAARPILNRSSLARNLSITSTRQSDHGPAPTLYGEGAKEGSVPTDENQATGLERLQLLGKMENLDVFLRKPDFSRKGTMEQPVMVPSLVRNHAECSFCGCFNLFVSRLQVVLSVARDIPPKIIELCGTLFIMTAGKPAARNVEMVGFTPEQFQHTETPLTLFSLYSFPTRLSGRNARRTPPLKKILDLCSIFFNRGSYIYFLRKTEIAF